MNCVLRSSFIVLKEYYKKLISEREKQTVLWYVYVPLYSYATVAKIWGGLSLNI